MKSWITKFHKMNAINLNECIKNRERFWWERCITHVWRFDQKEIDGMKFYGCDKSDWLLTENLLVNFSFSKSFVCEWWKNLKKILVPFWIFLYSRHTKMYFYFSVYLSTWFVGMENSSKEIYFACLERLK
jgi:hypothetical protein